MKSENYIYNLINIIKLKIENLKKKYCFQARDRNTKNKMEHPSEQELMVARAAFMKACAVKAEAGEEFDRVWDGAEDKTSDEFKGKIMTVKAKMKAADKAYMELGSRLELLVGR